MARETLHRCRSTYHLQTGDEADNEYLQMHSYVTVLPIVQGYFQVSSFDLPMDSDASERDMTSRVDYMIASRRSRYRAGLRYQRRGVDEEAHVANFVETETVMRIQVGHGARRRTPFCSHASSGIA